MRYYRRQCLPNVVQGRTAGELVLGSWPPKASEGYTKRIAEKCNAGHYRKRFKNTKFAAYIPS